MAKYKDQPIDQPAPVQGQRLDTADLGAMLRDRVRFGPEDNQAVPQVAAEWAAQMGIPVKQAVTVAWRVYREMMKGD
jgi:hypothetical protein